MRQSDATVCARLTAEAAAARRLADLLTESLAPDDAVSVFEADAGRWAVEIHFSQAPDEVSVRALVAALAGEEAGRALTFATIAARDWVAASLAGLKPVAAGRFLVHGAHDRAAVTVNRLGIEIEAALAFGTGHHGTTRGCLLALDALVKRQGKRKNARPKVRPNGGRGIRILDLGTGTGVLAIAAAKAWRRRVLASDIDPRAVAVARANAGLNRVAPFIELVCARGLTAPRLQGRFDLVFANILLGPLKLLAAPLAARLAPGAPIVLSGLLEAHANAALAAYRAQGLHLVRRISLDGWVTLVLAHSRLQRRDFG
jgi:ribosomal protein L11 methyltransferase